MTPEDFRKLGTENADFPCAHYNAFYLGCLLLYGKLTGDERCLTVGERGMRSIWRTYPHTVREQSETEEFAGGNPGRFAACCCRRRGCTTPPARPRTKPCCTPLCTIWKKCATPRAGIWNGTAIIPPPAAVRTGANAPC